MTMTELSDDAARIAHAAVMDAMIVCRRAAQRLSELGRVDKPDHSPVTAADFAAQAVIVRHLRRLGATPIVGEERADLLRQPDHASLRDAVVEAVRPVWPDASADAVLDAIDGAAGSADPTGHWVVDPIDGTRGFVRGRQYAVCLAYIEQARPRLALLGCPNLASGTDADLEVADAAGTLLLAEHGERTRWSHAVPTAALRVVEPASDQRPSPLRVTHSYDGTYSRLGEIDRVLERIGGPIERRPADSQAKYGMVARGQAHAYLRVPKDRQRAEHVWDHGPGWLIATAAGMTVTDLSGAPFDFTPGSRLANNYGVVCAHPSVHGELLEAIAALGLDRRDG